MDENNYHKYYSARQIESYFKNLPKKRMGVGVLFFNRNKELLVVNPVYKDRWSIPGGVVDKDESPLAGARREVNEELGIYPFFKKLLCVDYISTRSAQDRTQQENLQFIFFGGVLNAKQIASISLPDHELKGYRFATISRAMPLLGRKLRRRIKNCLAGLKKGETTYLENGEPV